MDRRGFIVAGASATTVALVKPSLAQVIPFVETIPTPISHQNGGILGVTVISKRGSVRVLCRGKQVAADDRTGFFDISKHYQVASNGITLPTTLNIEVEGNNHTTPVHTTADPNWSYAWALVYRPSGTGAETAIVYRRNWDHSQPKASGMGLVLRVFYNIAVA